MDKIFNKPFAVNGARVTIPENGTENERVSFDKGFTQPYEVEAPSIDNPAGQGFNILRPEMNEILNQLSNACNFLAENIDKWENLTTENLNNIIQAGRYNQRISTNATAKNNYPVIEAGFLIVILTGAYTLTQIYKGWRSDRIYIRRNQSVSQEANAWSAWDSLVLTSEYDTKITQLQNTDTNLNNNKEDKTRISTQNLDDENLNDINISGFYRQQTNAKATTANNYPKTEAGTLIVLIPSGSGSTYLTQIYIVKDGNGIFTRARKNNLSWTDWEKLALKSEVDLKRNISDSYSKSEVDSLIVSTNGYSHTGLTNANIANATIPIPNKNVTGCCIMVTAFYEDSINSQEHGSNFIFKIDGVQVGSVAIRWSRSGASGTMLGVNQCYINLSGKLGKTIVPSVTHLADSKFQKVNFLVVWQ